MDRRHFIAASGSAALVTTVLARGRSHAAAPGTTQWIVRTSEGFDALGFLSPLSGDPFYLKHYQKEVAEFEPRLEPDIIAGLKTLKAEIAESDGLMSPAFYLYFSAGPDATIEDIFASMESPEPLRRTLEASPYWSDGGWQRFVERIPKLRPILAALRDAGFRQFRNGLVAPVAAAKLPALRRKLADFDVIRWAEYYTGRKFDPTIEVVFMHFNKPHGIKIIGQRYLTGLAYRDEITIQTAAHEVLHPPVPMDGEAANAVMAVLEEDPLLQRILDQRDKSFGYGNIQGLFDEGLVKTLDQLISERLGVPEDPRERWRTQDGGMHVLAAAFYGIMKHDGFAAAGGNLEQWLLQKVTEGALHPPRLHRAAAEVLGYPVDELWRPQGDPSVEQ